MKNALKTKLKFSFNLALDNFFMGFENILGGIRQYSALSVASCVTASDDKGVVDANYPVVSWGKRKVTIPGDIVWGNLSFSEKDSARTFVVTLFEGVLLKLSSQGMGDEYLSHSKKLFLERLLHMKSNECPEAILKVAADYMVLCFNQGLAGNTLSENFKPQYNTGTRADMFARAMEKELGFERSGQGSIDLVVTEIEKATPGVASPLLRFVGVSKPVKGKTKWGKLSAFAQDSKKRSVMNSLDTETRKLLSGKAAGYAATARSLLAERLRHLEDNECPVKVLENVLRLMNQWFRVEDQNHDLFCQDYCINEKAKVNRKSSNIEADVEIEEDKEDSVENEKALLRLCDSADYLSDDLF